MTEGPLLVGIDASTTAVRAMVFDTSGNTVCIGRASLAYQRVGRDGYEQDADAWWTSTKEAIASALGALSPARRMDLVALSISHQRETVVVTDAAGRPLGPALLWMDSRCVDDVADATRNLGAVRLHALTGKPACTTPSVYKLMYLLRNRPELRDVAFVHDVHSFLSKKLTGRAVSSFASADPSGLVDIRNRVWSSSMTHLIGVDPHQLPELVEAGYLIGPLSQQAVVETGLPEHLLVYAGSGDGQAAGLGAGVVEKGRGYLDLGTAVTSGVITDSYQIDQAFRTMHAAVPGKFCLETALRGGMITLWWLIESLLGLEDRRAAREKLEVAALTLPPGSEGLLTLPYWAGVMNPYWDDDARGAFIGLHGGHEPRHLYRSVLEGIALEQRLHLEGVEAAIGGPVVELVMLGGGSRSDLWCQILADVLNRPIMRSRTPDAGALGVALLAAVSHGIFPSYEHAICEMTHFDHMFEPGVNQGTYERLYRDAYRGLYAAMAGRMHALAALREATVPTVPPPVPPTAR